MIPGRRFNVLLGHDSYSERFLETTSINYIIAIIILHQFTKVILRVFLPSPPPAVCHASLDFRCFITSRLVSTRFLDSCQYLVWRVPSLDSSATGPQESLPSEYRPTSNISFLLISHQVQALIIPPQSRQLNLGSDLSTVQDFYFDDSPSGVVP